MRYLRLTGRQRRLTWLVLAVLLTAGLGCAAVLHMRPIIVSLATARVSNAVNRIVVTPSGTPSTAARWTITC